MSGSTESDLQFVGLDALGSSQREQMAGSLVEAFGHQPSGYHTLDIARAEVARFSTDGTRAGFAAVSGETLVGWIGSIAHSEHAWELHPLVVVEGHRGRGVGTALVGVLERHARASGITTIWLGTDDDFGGTNLYGRDLYPDVLETLRGARPTAGHPISFYDRLGYVIVGVLPDVSGPGMHDILMAKRLR